MIARLQKLNIISLNMQLSFADVVHELRLVKLAQIDLDPIAVEFDGWDKQA